MGLIAALEQLTTQGQRWTAMLQQATAASIAFEEAAKRQSAALQQQAAAANGAAAAMGQLRQSAGSGGGGGGGENNLWGQNWMKAIGWDISDQLAQARAQDQRRIQTVLDGIKDAGTDTTKLKEIQTFLQGSIQSQKDWLTKEKASDETTRTQLEAARKAMEAAKGTNQYQNAFSTYNNLLTVSKNQAASLASGENTVEALQKIMEQLQASLAQGTAVNSAALADTLKKQTDAANKKAEEKALEEFIRQQTATLGTDAEKKALADLIRNQAETAKKQAETAKKQAEAKPDYSGWAAILKERADLEGLRSKINARPTAERDQVAALQTQIAAGTEQDQKLALLLAATLKEKDLAQQQMSAAQGTEGYAAAEARYLALVKTVEEQTLARAKNNEQTGALKTTLESLRASLAQGWTAERDLLDGLFTQLGHKEALTAEQKAALDLILARLGEGKRTADAAETYSGTDLSALIEAARSRGGHSALTAAQLAQLYTMQSQLTAQPSKTYQLDLTVGSNKLTALTDQDPQKFLDALLAAYRAAN